MVASTRPLACVASVVALAIAALAVPAAARDHHDRTWRQSGDERAAAWVTQVGSGSEDHADAVATDGKGNIYVAGYTTGAFPGFVNQGGIGDAVVWSFGPDGSLRWIDQFGSKGYDQATGVAVSDDGQIFVSGSAGGRLRGERWAGESDGFVRSYAADGTVLWTDQFGTDGHDRAEDIDVGRGVVGITGVTEGILVGSSMVGHHDGYIRTYRTNGRLLVTRQFGTRRGDGWPAGHVTPQGVAVDRQGSVLVTGQTGGPFGAADDGGQRGFVRAFDSGGHLQWTQYFFTLAPRAIAVSRDGQMAITDADGAVRVFDGTGAYVWGDDFDGHGADLDFDDRGRLYVAGSAFGPVNGDLGAGHSDGLVRSYTPGGKLWWSELYGTPARDTTTGIAVDASRVVAVGDTNGLFPGHVHDGVSTDAHVAQFVPSCGGQPATIIGTSRPDTIRGTVGPDVIVGRGGDDLIEGLGGDDIVCGGVGDDTLVGGHGGDALFGEAGEDQIRGGRGPDRVDGGPGHDHVRGQDDRDDLFGGTGDDRLYGGPGDDTITGAGGSDRLVGSLGDDHLGGGLADDRLIGGSGDDVLFGHDGADVLQGRTGDDHLDGGDGRDRCNGGDGVDTQVACEVRP